MRVTRKSLVGVVSVEDDLLALKLANSILVVVNSFSGLECSTKHGLLKSLALQPGVGAGGALNERLGIGLQRLERVDNKCGEVRGAISGGGLNTLFPVSNRAVRARDALEDLLCVSLGGGSDLSALRGGDDLSLELLTGSVHKTLDVQLACFGHELPAKRLVKSFEDGRTDDNTRSAEGCGKCVLGLSDGGIAVSEVKDGLREGAGGERVHRKVVQVTLDVVVVHIITTRERSVDFECGTIRTGKVNSQPRCLVASITVPASSGTAYWVIPSPLKPWILVSRNCCSLAHADAPESVTCMRSLDASIISQNFFMALTSRPP